MEKEELELLESEEGRLSASDEIDNYINMFNQLTGLDEHERYKEKPQIKKSKEEEDIIEELKRYSETIDESSDEKQVKEIKKETPLPAVSLTRPGQSSEGVKAKTRTNPRIIISIILTVVVLIWGYLSFTMSGPLFANKEEIAKASRFGNMPTCSAVVAEVSNLSPEDDQTATKKVLFQFTNPETNTQAVSWYYVYEDDTTEYRVGETEEMRWDKSSNKLIKNSDFKEMQTTENKKTFAQKLGMFAIIGVPAIIGEVLIIIRYKKEENLK